MHERTGGKRMRRYSRLDNLTTRRLRLDRHRYNSLRLLVQQFLKFSFNFFLVLVFTEVEINCQRFA